MKVYLGHLTPTTPAKAGPECIPIRTRTRDPSGAVIESATRSASCTPGVDTLSTASAQQHGQRGGGRVRHPQRVLLAGGRGVWTLSPAQPCSRRGSCKRVANACVSGVHLRYTRAIAHFAGRPRAADQHRPTGFWPALPRRSALPRARAVAARRSTAGGTVRGGAGRRHLGEGKHALGVVVPAPGLVPRCRHIRCPARRRPHTKRRGTQRSGRERAAALETACETAHQTPAVRRRLIQAPGAQSRPRCGSRPPPGALRRPRAAPRLPPSAVATAERTAAAAFTWACRIALPSVPRRRRRRYAHRRVCVWATSAGWATSSLGRCLRGPEEGLGRGSGGWGEAPSPMVSTLWTPCLEATPQCLSDPPLSQRGGTACARGGGGMETGRSAGRQRTLKRRGRANRCKSVHASKR